LSSSWSCIARFVELDVPAVKLLPACCLEESWGISDLLQLVFPVLKARELKVLRRVVLMSSGLPRPAASGGLAAARSLSWFTFDVAGLFCWSDAAAVEEKTKCSCGVSLWSDSSFALKLLIPSTPSLELRGRISCTGARWTHVHRLRKAVSLLLDMMKNGSAFLYDLSAHPFLEMLLLPSHAI
jgi:hypothetical protein